MTDNSIDMQVRDKNIEALAGYLNDTTHAELAIDDCDLETILQHQLNTPIADDLRLLLPLPDDSLRELPKCTFVDLFIQSKPSITALRLVKEFAKAVAQSEEAYPSQVAHILYYGSIVAARVNGATTISDLPHTQLEKGFAWAASLDWLPAELRTLFNSGLCMAS